MGRANPSSVAKRSNCGVKRAAQRRLFRFRHLTHIGSCPASTTCLAVIHAHRRRAGLLLVAAGTHGNHDAVAPAANTGRCRPREFSRLLPATPAVRAFCKPGTNGTNSVWRNPASRRTHSDRWTRSGRARVTARHAPRPGCDLPSTRATHVPTTPASPSRPPIPKRTRNGCKPGSPSLLSSGNKTTAA